MEFTKDGRTAQVLTDDQLALELAKAPKPEVKRQ